MATINMDSIIAKAQKCMGTSQKRAEVNKHIDKIFLSGLSFKTGGGMSVHTPEEAADAFCRVLRTTLLSHAGSDHAGGDIGFSAIEALSDLDYTSPKKVGENTYIIEVYFSGDLHRQSLAPGYFTEGVDNIAALLNNGYTAGHTVWGMWHHDDRIRGLTMRNGTHFVEQAISDFMGNYALEYGVVSIEPNEIYK